jgi:hypothetical protein
VAALSFALDGETLFEQVHVFGEVELLLAEALQISVLGRTILFEAVNQVKRSLRFGFLDLRHL